MDTSEEGNTGTKELPTCQSEQKSAIIAEVQH